ncbi:MAG TPA: magnesium/cobalt transporter CorA [Thermoanaerobaculia bacterium]|nr:magnesium/cobalt transporter CorA [Thermoanaerobaculia bacterium]
MTKFRVALLRGEEELTRGGLEVVDAWQPGSEAKLWIDIAEPTQEAIEPLLEGRFGFHELAAEDTLSPETLPKYDPYPNYDFFVFRAVGVDLGEHASQSYKLAAFLGGNFLVTVHKELHNRMNEIWERLPGHKRLLSAGPDFLLHAIVDAMVDEHFPLLEKIDDCVDEVQDAIFTDPRPGQLDELLHLKRDVNLLRRHSLPQRDLLNQISRGDAQFVRREHLIYFRDVYDHMFRITETIDVQRDAMAGAMDAYLSVIANRTNEIMRVLTVFSAIMLPLSLIAGIYGMNFEHIPELHWRDGYWYALGLMAIIAVAMLIFFRRKGWIGRGADLTRPRSRV